MFSFLSFLDKQILDEGKQIVFNNGKKYGQIVFLAGGAGSGKGYVTKNILEFEKFKIRDVDEFKIMYLKLNKLKNKFPELKDLNLKNPKDVFKLHTFVKSRGTLDKSLENLLTDLNSDRLPNIIFDVTMKDMEYELIDTVLNLGYSSEDIHIVWVLTDYKIAIVRNKSRSRVVPDDILLKTHEGAAKTMYDVIFNKSVANLIDGSIFVVLGDEDQQIHWTDKEGNKKIKSKYIDKDTGDEIIKYHVKYYPYLKVKETGKPINMSQSIGDQLYAWIKDNIPKTKLTKDIF